MKVAIYTRTATKELSSMHSLDAQENELMNVVNRNGYEVYDIYSDFGKSGIDFNRPEIERMLKDLYDDKFDAILVRSLDRLSRQSSDVLNLLLKILVPHNKKLFVMDEEYDTSFFAINPFRGGNA